MENHIGQKEEELTYRAPDFSSSSSSTRFGHESDTRRPYQRDLGRIIHSASFRRLQAKTQVLGTGEGDFHRTRLTHTLEVGQLGRGIVWFLLDHTSDEFKSVLPPSELIEAICYAHDLGHPPFGHGGERALHKKMHFYGGFERNAQTIRILTRLEKYYRGDGIRPTRRLLLGVLKYPVAFSRFDLAAHSLKPPKCYFDSEADIVASALSVFAPKDVELFTELGSDGKAVHKTLDCSIMEIADDIAYGVHDLEDGIARKLLLQENVEPALKNAAAEAGLERIGGLSFDLLIAKLFSEDSCERKHAISLLVGLFVTSVTLDRRHAFSHPLLDMQASLSPDRRRFLDVLKNKITFDRIVARREVQTLEYKGERIVADLFDAFMERPLELVGKEAFDGTQDGLAEVLKASQKSSGGWQNNCDEPTRLAITRSISDFTAGMTNPYAEKFHRRLFEPGYGSSTDDL